MLREGVRLSGRHQAWLYGSAGALLGTGALWTVFHYFLQVEGEFGEQPHVLEPWWLKLHGAAAMVFLMVLGSLVRGHVRLGWKSGINRSSGAILVTVTSFLVLTGWALYYVGVDGARPWISASHWGVGLASPFALLVHVVRGRGTRRARLVSRQPGSEDDSHSRASFPEAVSARRLGRS
jgi:hypothetical protein